MRLRTLLTRPLLAVTAFAVGLTVSAALVVFAQTTLGDDDLTRFVPGTPIVADDVNGNFDTLRDAVNDHAADLADLAGRMTELETRLTRIEENACPRLRLPDGTPRAYILSQREADAPYTVCTFDLGAGRKDEMVRVGDFWIDRYEMSTADGEDGVVNGYGTTATARSVAGVEPKRFVSWFQAAQMCANAGKRLCTNLEWQTAVSGTPDPGDGVIIPNGRAPNDACNVSHNAGQGEWAGDNGEPANTRAHADCVSRFGAFDMVGNLDEWTAIGIRLEPPGRPSLKTQHRPRRGLRTVSRTLIGAVTGRGT